MTVPPAFDRFPAWLPYALGTFMLIPYALWFGLWLFAFPGDKNGFESVGPVLFLVSVPLVVWFGLCSLGFIANSMAGASEFRPPVGGAIAEVLAVLPAATLWLGAAGAFLLVAQDRPWVVALAPVAVGAVIAAAIRLGEAARRADRAAAARVRHAPEPGSSPDAGSAPLPAVVRRTALWVIMAALAVVLGALIMLRPG